MLNKKHSILYTLKSKLTAHYWIQDTINRTNVFKVIHKRREKQKINGKDTKEKKKQMSMH